jgi:hypothetical protein
MFSGHMHMLKCTNVAHKIFDLRKCLQKKKNYWVNFVPRINFENGIKLRYELE